VPGADAAAIERAYRESSGRAVATLDRMRRESSRYSRETQSALLHAETEPTEVGPVHDDPLRLIFTCCHPALAPAGTSVRSRRAKK